MAEQNEIPAIKRPTKQNFFAGARKITPVQAAFDKPAADKLFVRLTGDNLSTSAVFAYTLLSDEDAPLAGGSVVINGDDYTNWSGDNSTPYTFVAGKIGVTLV